MILRAIALALLSITIASPACAHDAIESAGPFINGLLHPLVIPAHVLSFIALGLWIGQQERAQIRSSVIGFTIALAIGLILGPIVDLPPQTMDIIALGIAVLAASGWRNVALPPAISVVTAIVTGIDAMSDDPITSAGIWVSALLIVLNIVNLVMRVERPWLRIGIRVAGAWIAAIALMLLALSWRGVTL